MAQRLQHATADAPHRLPLNAGGNLPEAAYRRIRRVSLIDEFVKSAATDLWEKKRKSLDAELKNGEPLEKIRLSPMPQFLQLAVRETLIKRIPFMVRQAHHERNQHLTVRPEPVEGLNQHFLRRTA